jgi:hypothetical protein
MRSQPFRLLVGLAHPLELPCKAIAIESLTGAIAIGNAVDAYMPLPLLACADISLGRGSATPASN